MSERVIEWEPTEHGYAAEVGDVLLLVNPPQRDDRWLWEMCCIDWWYDEGGWCATEEHAKAAAVEAAHRHEGMKISS